MVDVLWGSCNTYARVVGTANALRSRDFTPATMGWGWDLVQLVRIQGQMVARS